MRHGVSLLHLHVNRRKRNLALDLRTRRSGSMASEQASWRDFYGDIGRLDLFERWPGSKHADHALGNRRIGEAWRVDRDNAQLARAALAGGQLSSQESSDRGLPWTILACHEIVACHGWRWERALETRGRVINTRRREPCHRDEGSPMKDDGGSLPAVIIRLAVGPTMFAHGYNKAFGGGGIQGTERWFGGLGFRPASAHARVAATTEMTSGVLMTLGALNPLPSAAVIGIMTVAARSDHRGKGFFVFKGGWEYVAVLSAVCTALAGLGYGRWSVDRILGNRRKGWKAALTAAALGVGNGALVLATTYRPRQEEPAETPTASPADVDGSYPMPETGPAEGSPETAS